uniref:Uncharacterized protein n=1 Tax=Anguilla anguilla TaxID=7936 RepID=A0A0E9X807_ANGAN
MTYSIKTSRQHMLRKYQRPARFYSARTGLALEARPTEKSEESEHPILSDSSSVQNNHRLSAGKKYIIFKLLRCSSAPVQQVSYRVTRVKKVISKPTATAKKTY